MYESLSVQYILHDGLQCSVDGRCNGQCCTDRVDCWAVWRMVDTITTIHFTQQCIDDHAHAPGGVQGMQNCGNTFDKRT